MLFWNGFKIRASRTGSVSVSLEFGVAVVRILQGKKEKSKKERKNDVRVLTIVSSRSSAAFFFFFFFFASAAVGKSSSSSLAAGAVYCSYYVCFCKRGFFCDGIAFL
jgi:hypothetical protein